MPLRHVVRAALVTAVLCLAGTALSSPASAAAEADYPTVSCANLAFDADAGTVSSLSCLYGFASRDIGPAWVRDLATDELFWCDHVSYYYGGPLSPFRIVTGSGCRVETAKPAG